MNSSRRRDLRRIVLTVVSVWMFLFGSMAVWAQDFFVSLSEKERHWLSEHPTLRLGVGIAFPPFMWVEKEDGKTVFKGIVSDYVGLLASKLNTDMELTLDIRFDEALARGRTGRIDLFPCLSKTPERTQFLLFTKPYLSYPLVIITREDAPIAGGIEDLRGKRVAVVKHLVVYSKLKSDYAALDIDYVLTRKTEENLEAVSLGRADACITNLAVATYYIRKKGLTNLRIVASVDWESGQLCMGIRKDWPVLEGIIKKALASISQEEKDRITQRWIQAPYEPGLNVKRVWRWSLGIGLGIACLFFLVLLWNRRLKREILDKQKAQKSLLESEARLRSIFNTSSDAILIFNAEGALVMTNPAACRMYGYDETEMIGLRGKEIVHPDYRHLFGAFIKECVETGHFLAESMDLRKDGTPFHVEVHGSLFEYKGSRHLMAIVRDVTVRKKAEAALRSSREEFKALYEKSKKEYELYYSILHTSADAVVIYDLKGNVKYVNPSFTHIFGWTLRDLEGRRVPFVPESEREGTLAGIKDIIEHGKPVRKFRTKRCTKDGRTLDISVSGSRYNDHEGKPAGMLVILRDITLEKRLEDQLQQAHKMEAIGTLAGGIAHDFNNILSIILGNAELAIDDIPDGKPTREFLKEIRKASFRARELVQQILSFARKTMTSLKPLEINTIVKESLKLMRASIPAMVDIHSNIPSEPSMILGDPTEIHQIVINLCTNAAHAMKTSGGTLEVGLSEVALDEKTAPRYEDLSPGVFVKLTVIDNGEGIPPDILEKVFEPYFTTKAFGAGSGMGLAVVHGLVKKGKGAIDIKSTVGKGTTVEVLFPKIEEAAPATEKKDDELPTGNERVLVVDDDSAIVNMTGQMLKRLGYFVTEKTDSTAALESFKSSPEDFDLVITDMSMPKMSGDRLAAELMKIRRDIPILLCTGHSDSVDEKKARKLGIKGFAMKPLDKGKLARAVRAVLDN